MFSFSKMIKKVAALNSKVDIDDAFSEDVADEKQGDDTVFDEAIDNEQIQDDQPIGDEIANDESVGDEIANDESVGDEVANDESVGDEPANDDGLQGESVVDETPILDFDNEVSDEVLIKMPLDEEGKVVNEGESNIEDINDDLLDGADDESEEADFNDMSSQEDSYEDNTSDSKNQVSPYHDQIVWGVAFATAILLFMSNFHLSGVFGNILNNFLFGMFGLPAYISPIMLLFVVYVYLNNKQSIFGVRKVVSSICFFLTLCSMLQLYYFNNSAPILTYFKDSANEKTGGGLIGGLCCKLLYNLFGLWGSLVVLVILSIILLIIITEKRIFEIVGKLFKAIGALIKKKATKSKVEEKVSIDLDKLDSAIVDSNEEKPKKKFRTFNFLNDSFDGDEDDEDDEDMDDNDNGCSDETQNEKNDDELSDGDLLKDGIYSGQRIVFAKPSIKEPLYSADEDICDKELNNKFNKQNDIRNLADSLFEGKENIEVETTNKEENDVNVDSNDVHVFDDYGMNNVVDASSIEEQKEVGSIEEQKEVGSTQEQKDASSTQEQRDVSSTQEQKEVSSMGEQESQPIQELVLDKDKADSGEQMKFSSSLYHSSDEKRDDEITAQDIINTLESIKNATELAAKSIENENVQPVASKNLDDVQKNVVTTNEVETKSQNIQQEPSVKKPVRKKKSYKYKFPDINFLVSGDTNTSDTKKECEAVAQKLVSTLDSFGVNVTLTDISYGPIVTRYEIQPAQGVKVSKITSLTDDIKLNLAAEQIRIEAPIPGKAAIGIEVPNKGETKIVRFRELIESKEFKKCKSDVAFAVGKDISGHVVIADIAKMPHLLIAGQTGAGKSVCINTLIMSILYKANPNDVKLIMIDPKVVELSIYNGIPHLLIPVVTDPKKAYGALNWAVTEMVARYKKFADMHVRDITSYNDRVAKKFEMSGVIDEENKKMHQIVIIVDELADLMMASPDKVESAICRLAQMARAAGIHLIIATQRPSVNVITGLIKANIPSRIAFSVASAVDSRTIIDGGGAEKLLGRGDMLFFPTGYPKPVRVQGAYISDKEVTDVVEYLISQNLDTQDEFKDIEEKIEENAKIEENEAVKSQREIDEYFEDAAKFVIQKEKASIGMLQRFYKIGFNRAARIMDQLYEAGVVGEEEGTKPRSVRMTLDDFEKYKESSKIS